MVLALNVQRINPKVISGEGFSLGGPRLNKGLILDAFMLAA